MREGRKMRRKKRMQRARRVIAKEHGYAVLHDGSKLPYAAYIRSDHWLAVKKRYRASKLPQTCLACGGTPVDLHHRTYNRLGQEWLTDLVPLCREHHNQVHNRLNRRKKRSKLGLWGATNRIIRRVKKGNKHERPSDFMGIGSTPSASDQVSPDFDSQLCRQERR